MSSAEALSRRVQVLGLLATASFAATAQDALITYKCPGPVYTNLISAQEARDKGCKAVEGQLVTVVPAPPRAKPPATGNGASAPRSGDSKVDSAAQRARDSDARRILADELRAEEDRLAAMKAEFGGGEPERKGDERNFAKYQDRVNEMRAAIQRKEADIAALRREMAKLPQ